MIDEWMTIKAKITEKKNREIQFQTFKSAVNTKRYFTKYLI